MARGGVVRKTVSDAAVVLRTGALGEADRLVTVLLREVGKVRCAARGARKSRRRFAGGLGPGVRGRAEVALAPRGLARLLSFEAALGAQALGRDLEVFACTAYLAELTDALVAEQDPDPALFDALSDALDGLAREGADPCWLRRYELRLLVALGAMPALDRCAVCGGAARGEAVAFAWDRGGALCSVHADGAATIAANDLAGVARVAAWSGGAPAPAFDARQAAFVRAFCQRGLARHLRRPLRSLDALRALVRGGRRPATARAGTDGPDG